VLVLELLRNFTSPVVDSSDFFKSHLSHVVVEKILTLETVGWIIWSHTAITIVLAAASLPGKVGIFLNSIFDSVLFGHHLFLELTLLHPLEHLVRDWVWLVFCNVYVVLLYLEALSLELLLVKFE